MGGSAVGRRATILALAGMAVLAACTSSGTRQAVATTTTVAPVATTTTVAAVATTTTVAPVAYDRSCEKSAKTQIDMDSCAASELKQLQGQLASAVANEGTALNPTSVEAAQNAFEQYEVAECDAVASQNLGGTIYPLIVTTCQISLTVQRIQQVRADAEQAHS